MVISEAYREQQRELYRDPAYGVASLTFAPLVAELVRGLNCKSVADYGAGKRNLEKGLAAAGVLLDYRPYDPAFPEYGAPLSADLVCCIDVLEHIEPEYLDAVIADLRQITVRHGFFTIHTGPARKVLSDGRNAHLIQEPAEWWLERLSAHFSIVETKPFPSGLLVLVTPLT